MKHLRIDDPEVAALVAKEEKRLENTLDLIAAENTSTGTYALFFTADDGTNGRELWISDGTTAGTVMLKDINPGAAGSSPSNLGGFACMSAA